MMSCMKRFIEDICDVYHCSKDLEVTATVCDFPIEQVSQVIDDYYDEYYGPM